MVKKYISSDLALAFAAASVENGTMSREQYENKRTLLTASRHRHTARPVSYISAKERRGVLR